MNHVIFANGWFELVVIIGFVTVSVLGHLFRHVREASGNEKSRPAAPPARRSRSEAVREDMEQMLRDMGVKPAEITRQEMSTPPPPRRQPTPPKPARRLKRTEPAKVEPQPAERVRDRHLKSDVSQRHAAEMHTGIESRHLAESVHGLAPVAGSRPATPAAAPTPAAPANIPLIAASAIAGKIRNKEDLAIALILGDVLGSPRGFSD